MPSLVNASPRMRKDVTESESANVTVASPSGERLWVYSFTDTWGYASEFDVEFDATGVVESTSIDRIN